MTDASASDTPSQTTRPASGPGRYRFMPKPAKIFYLLTPVLAITLFVVHWFSIPIFGKVMASTVYYYLLYAILAGNVFLGLGATRKLSRQAVPWYDYLLALAVAALAIFFAFNAEEITYRNWDTPPNAWIFAAALAMGALSIEAGRRVGGWGYIGLILVSIVYPLFASSPWLLHNLGGVFYGISFSFPEVVGSFAFGADGMLGMSGRLLGELVLGFFLFAGLVIGLGGGEFFIKLASSLMGRFRGGQAKGAVVASAFFGSITGSPIANIAGTGSFTIPAMKQAGYSPEYAAAIEACASTGSDTMPPVLGGLAFMMVIIFGVDYADVVLAALLPSILFFLGLLVQIDAYAARHNLKTVPDPTIPPWWQVLLSGWSYLVSFAVLIFGLVYMRWGAITPIYASAVMLLLKFAEECVKILCRPSEMRRTFKDSLQTIAKRIESGLSQTASLINYAVAIFIGMGFIMVGLLKTGMAAGLAGWIVGAGGSNIYLVLLICLIFSIIMGLAELQRTGYILLAVIAVPAIISLSQTVPEFATYGGLPIIGLNLFFISYASLGGITPPVALHSFVAASIADANPMKTSWLSCRLGIVLFFLPIFFVLQPSLLIIYTPWWQTAISFLQAALGIWLLSSALEGYLVFVGTLHTWQRVMLFISGLVLAFPQPVMLAIGLVASIVTIAIALVINKKRVTHSQL